MFGIQNRKSGIVLGEPLVFRQPAIPAQAGIQCRNLYARPSRKHEKPEFPDVRKRRFFIHRSRLMPQRRFFLAFRPGRDQKLPENQQRVLWMASDQAIAATVTVSI